jgi:hypothetical protein
MSRGAAPPRRRGTVRLPASPAPELNIWAVSRLSATRGRAGFGDALAFARVLPQPLQRAGARFPACGLIFSRSFDFHAFVRLKAGSESQNPRSFVAVSTH